MKIAFLILATFAVSTSSLTAEPAKGQWRSTDYSSFDAVAQLPAEQCTAILNDCEACALKPDGKLMCSTPGFSCQPSRWTCAVFVPVKAE